MAGLISIIQEINHPAPIRINLNIITFNLAFDQNLTERLSLAINPYFNITYISRRKQQL